MFAMTLSTVGANRATAESGLLKIDGGELYFNAVGSGCPVVFLGGGSLMDHRQWEAQFAAFQDRFRVIGLDSRGVGRSPLPTRPFSFSQDLAMAFDLLGIERAVVVGASFAGRVAIDFAITHPERVSGVVAVAPALGGYEFSEDFNGRNAELFATISGVVAALVRAVLDDPHFIPSPGRPAARERAEQLIPENIRTLETDPSLIVAMDPPAVERLGEIEAPLLLVLGDRDHRDLYDIAKTLSKQLSTLTQVEIPNAGHNPHMENPTVFDHQLNAFLESLRCD